MALDERLMCVTTEVSSDCHADIGTDHALLPLYLLNNGLCSKVVATEKSPNALRVARQALWGRNAEVLFRLIGLLEDNEDVQHVWANFDIDDELLAQLEG